MKFKWPWVSRKGYDQLGRNFDSMKDSAIHSEDRCNQAEKENKRLKEKLNLLGFVRFQVLHDQPEYYGLNVRFDRREIEDSNLPPSWVVCELVRWHIDSMYPPGDLTSEGDEQDGDWPQEKNDDWNDRNKLGGLNNPER